jgi:hypothetical protein
MSDIEDDWGNSFILSIIDIHTYLNLEKQAEDDEELEKKLNKESKNVFKDEDAYDSEEERKKKKAEELKKTPVSDSTVPKKKSNKKDYE